MRERICRIRCPGVTPVGADPNHRSWGWEYRFIRVVSSLREFESRNGADTSQRVLAASRDACLLHATARPQNWGTMTTTPPPYAPSPTPPASEPLAKQNNGVGLAALIVGIVALFFAIIPILSFIAWLPALAAIVLGIVGLVLKGRKKLFAGLGLGLGIVAWIVAIIVSVVSAMGVVAAAGDALESIEPSTAAEAPAAATETEAPAEEAPAVADGLLTYEVTSDAAVITSVTYMTATADGTGQEQATDTAAPFTKEQSVPTGIFEMGVFSLVAQATGDATTISCKITYEGEVIAEQTSTGAYSVVTCTGTSS